MICEGGDVKVTDDQIKRKIEYYSEIRTKLKYLYIAIATSITSLVMGFELGIDNKFPAIALFIGYFIMFINFFDFISLFRKKPKKIKNPSDELLRYTGFIYISITIQATFILLNLYRIYKTIFLNGMDFMLVPICVSMIIVEVRHLLY